MKTAIESTLGRETRLMQPGSTWQNKTVLVTGGSSGLGKAIAQAFAEAGARVAIAARRAEPLAHAAEELRNCGGAVLSIQADLTRQEDVDRMVGETVAQFGGLDVLVNNVGRSSRGSVLETPPEEFRDLIELNLIATVRCTRAAAPHLLAARGHVVNISSLGGKSAARYLGAYNASKFALSAYTQQLRLELGPQGLHVLLVCPGPLARSEVRTYGAEQMDHLPDSARQPGGGVKTKLIEPEWLARRIVRACERREVELVVPAKARILFALLQLFPSVGDYLVKKLT
jgi:NAD(P)-dependent dehydrogenase (short-subunit alcohol dehydrogenase family)